MKKHISLTLITVLITCTSLIAGNWEQISSVSTKSLTIRLEWKVDKNNYRINPDGTKFYKTELRLFYDNGREKGNYEIPDQVYTMASLDGAGTPCMIIDPTNESVTVFVQEKDPTSRDYAMSGYAYILNKGKEHFVKETIFTRSNFGWFAFFGGSNNGNPTLCHFSFAGYMAVESKRNSNGTWNNYIIGNITSNNASAQWKSHKNILISDKSSTDNMSGITNSSYSISSIYNPPANNSSTALSEDEKLGLFLGGLFVVGAAIYKGLDDLPQGNSHNAASSSSNSSSTSSPSSSNHYSFELMEWNENENYAKYKVLKNGEWYAYETEKVKWYYGEFCDNCYGINIGGGVGHYNVDKQKVYSLLSISSDGNAATLEQAVLFFLKDKYANK